MDEDDEEQQVGESNSDVHWQVWWIVELPLMTETVKLWVKQNNEQIDAKMLCRAERHDWEDFFFWFIAKNDPLIFN